MPRVNDVGEPLKHWECPACMTIADSTAAGWSGGIGDDIQCELLEGHGGPHKHVVEWDDHERSYGWQKRAEHRPD